MSERRFPDCVARLLWDVDAERLDPDRDRGLVMERVMSRGTWEAMKWLRARYRREELVEYLKRYGARRLSPRDFAYWALVCGLEVEVGAGGGRPGWAGPLTADEALPVPRASVEDLACMKIAAIAGRGAAKDFWDLDELLDHGLAGGTLTGALALYTRKFPAVDVDHAIRSLAYFGDADAAPLPAGLSREHWAAIKGRFAERVREL